ncbi:acyl-CoA dehydrogenase [Agrobacterium vitis]|uniref:acyl-CoA dehydrogenase n=1 Tax=Agrobacterium vitis TaxID=373 RepID=UPI00135442ED|nr:acyl-CoA dehydrogenase [Agrobacterium vitis]
MVAAKERTVVLATKSTQKQVTPLAQPEPGLTPEQIIQRAIDLRPLLLDGQADAEERGTYSPEMHERFRKAGFYRILQPVMYGGYEFDLTVFSRVIVEIARGCPGSGWCLCLASGHAVNAAALFDKAGQDIIFGNDGEFAAPARGVPGGTATECDDGWIIDGTWDYCSGSPYSTHAIVGVRIAGPAKDGPPELGIAMVPRSGWEMIDNWRDFIGMRASGSNSIRIDKQWIPKALLVRQNFFAVNIDGGTEGYKLHGNSMYSGRMFGFFQAEITSILVGVGFAALDEFERIVGLRAGAPKFGPPMPGVPDFHRPYGVALGMLEMASNALAAGTRSYLDYCERGVKDPSAYTEFDDLRIQAGLQHAAHLSMDAVEILYSAAGTSTSAKNGSRLQRYYRDISMARTNPGLQFDKTAMQLAARKFPEGPQGPRP